MGLCKRNLKFIYVYACFFSFSVLAACAGHDGSSLLPSVGNGANNRAPSAPKHRRATATAIPTITGKIDALITGGITIKVSSGCGLDYGYLHVYKTTTTAMTGPAPAVGLYARLTVASGTCSTSITASAMTITTTPPTPQPSASPAATASPIASPTPRVTAAPTGSPIPLQPAKSSVSSTIDGVATAKFVLNPAGGVGYMPIYTNASTIYVGAKPANGLYAQVTGTGALSNFTGTFAAISSTAPAGVTVSGTAVAATSYGFTLNAGTGSPAIPIVLNGQTAVGGAPLTVGSTVKVVGKGWQSLAITAQQVVVSTPAPANPTPTPSPIAQTHVLTADYLGAPYGTTAISWSAASPYLSWAQVSSANANAISAAGIKTQYYIDPNQTANNGDSMWSTNEAEFAHDCNGNRLSYSYDNATMYQMAIDNAALQSQFASVVSQATSGAHFDLVWEDGTGVLGTVPLNAMPCNYSDAAWLQDGAALNGVSPKPVMFNGLGELNGQSPSQSLAYLSGPNTVGGNFEFCYSGTSNPKISGWVWQATENTELQVAAQNKLFECQLRNTDSASTQTDARLFALASFFLTYNPATSILWEEFSTTSGLHVLPESQFVLLAPKVAAPASVTGLQQSGGSYAREYNQCYYAGKFVGSCAVVINPDTGTSHPFPFPQYTHTLVLSGGGVLDGGAVSTSGPAPPMSVPADSAIIAFP